MIRAVIIMCLPLVVLVGFVVIGLCVSAVEGAQ